MRIAFVQPMMTFRGGAESVIVWLASALAGRGHEVSILSLRSQPAIWEGDVDISPVHFVDIGPMSPRPFGKRVQSRLLSGTIRKVLPTVDVICANNFPSTWWLHDATRTNSDGVFTAVYCHEPNRATYFPVTDSVTVEYATAKKAFELPNHHDISRIVEMKMARARRWKMRSRQRVDRVAMAGVGVIMANSEFTAGNVHRAWGREAVVCYPGVPQGGETNIQGMTGRSGVVCFSNLVLSKNLYGVLGAFDRLVNAYHRTDIPLHLIGRADDQRVRRFVQERGLDSVVQFHGFVSEEEKDSRLSSCRLCIFVPLAEPLGLVTIEAMLHGTPVIGSRSGGPAEVIRDGVTGLLTDPYDPDAIARSILAVYDDVPRLDAMAKVGMELARRDYTLDRFAADFEEILLRRMASA